MVEIRLKAKDKSEERIKAYLEENASPVLAEKINGGVVIEKDGKQLLNVKSLSGFMKWACEEARKQAEKGASSACIDDQTVFGWAIHYFEESSIEETLYNDDGTEYNPPKPVKKPSTVPVTQKPAVKKIDDGDGQQSIFDMLPMDPVKEETKESDAADDDDAEVEVDEEDIELGDKDTEMDAAKEEITDDTRFVAVKKEEPKISPLYTQYMAVQEKYPDAVIAKRIGDFYEVFGTPARIIAPELELTLTGRDCGLPERVPMVGFPYHRAEDFFGKIRNLHKLVISDQNGEEVRDRYVPVANKIVDTSTGEVVADVQKTEQEIFDEKLERSFDPEYLADLYTRLDNQINIY